MDEFWYEIWDSETRNLIFDSFSEERVVEMLNALDDPNLYVLKVYKNGDIEKVKL